jgi:hypothetical protein
MTLAKLYPNDFSSMDLIDLNQQLCLYIIDVRGDDRFSNIQTIVGLSQKNGGDWKETLLSFGISSFKACHS